MKKRTKKISALALALISVLIIVCSCGDGDSGNGNKESGISSEIKYELMSKIAYFDVTSGGNLSYRSHTVSVSDLGDGEYSVSGTVTAADGSSTYAASYSGTATYDSSSDDYDFDIDLGNFYSR